MAGQAVRVLVAYLLGSVVGSLLLGRLRGVDIRKVGSGNAGGTNALRTQGKLFALGVVIIDVAKGWIAVRWVPGAAAPEWTAVLCGLAAIVGHVYPLWYGFRGGKGAATLIGALAGLAPLLLVPVLLAWLLMVAVAGFIGLATMTAAAVVPWAVWLLALEPRAPLMTFALACAALIVYTHRSNVRRMRAGTEPRARRLWVLGRLGR